MAPRISHDDGSQSLSKQTLTSFQARQKLLANGETKKKKATTKKHTKTASTSTKKVVGTTEPSATTANATSSSSHDNNTTNTTSNALVSTPANPYGGLGAGLGYGGMMGMGMYGGMYGSPYGMGMGMGPLNSLNQFLFGVQTAIYSLSSAVQVIGMNTQALHQLLDGLSSMVDHALATWQELRALEASANEQETEEQKMRRRRLKALRWAMVVAATYAAYRILRSLLSARKGPRRKRLASGPYNSSSSSMQNYNAVSPYNSGGYSPYSSGYGMSPYGSAGMGGMYGGGAYGGAGYY